MSTTGELEVAEIWRLIRGAKLYLFVGLLVGAVVSVGVSVALRPTFRTQTVLVPVDSSQAGGMLGSLVGQLGGLASLAGISSGGGSQKEEYLALLKSRQLASKFLDSNRLFGAMQTSAFRSLRSTSESSELTPSQAYRSVQRFQQKVLSISEDRRAGTITVSIEWYDAVEAAHWANMYVSMANEDLRNRAIEHADSALRFLNEEVAKANSVQVQQTIYKLIETQLNAKTLAVVNKEFAFRVIDPAVLPDTRSPSTPRKFLFAMGGGLIGMGAGLGIFIRSRRKLNQ